MASYTFSGAAFPLYLLILAFLVLTHVIGSVTMNLNEIYLNVARLISFCSFAVSTICIHGYWLSHMSSERLAHGSPLFLQSFLSPFPHDTAGLWATVRCVSPYGAFLCVALGIIAGCRCNASSLEPLIHVLSHALLLLILLTGPRASLQLSLLALHVLTVAWLLKHVFGGKLTSPKYVASGVAAVVSHVHSLTRLAFYVTGHRPDFGTLQVCTLHFFHIRYISI